MKIKLPKIKKLRLGKLLSTELLIKLVAIIVLCVIGFLIYQHINKLQKNLTDTQESQRTAEIYLQEIGSELEGLKSRDEYNTNLKLEEEIKNIQKNYNSAVSVYENLLELKEKTDKTDVMDELFTDALVYLSERNYASASTTLKSLGNQITEKEKRIAATFKIPENIIQSSSPPASGYSRQSVKTNVGTFLVSIIAADISSTKIIVDTASDSDCGNDCPVLPLATYVSRNGAFAGVNGSYFCPATYPSCAGKKNSYDLLAMNHKKTYFNSNNNIYSNNPAVIFGDNYIRFVNSASEWGRDTDPTGVLSNFPMLVFNKEIKFGGDDDPKKGSKGNRSFVANIGNTVYIGVVHSATVAESARVMNTLGMDNTMNLDSGGSTALWSGGYKVGPGRNLPNVILFVRK